MARDVFAFSLVTPEEFEKGHTIFDTDGGLVGRVIYKSKATYEGSYTYHIESTKETFSKIETGEITLYHMEQYHVSTCNVWYTN